MGNIFRLVRLGIVTSYSHQVFAIPLSDREDPRTCRVTKKLNITASLNSTYGVTAGRHWNLFVVDDARSIRPASSKHEVKASYEDRRAIACCERRFAVSSLRRIDTFRLL